MTEPESCCSKFSETTTEHSWLCPKAHPAEREPVRPWASGVWWLIPPQPTQPPKEPK